MDPATSDAPDSERTLAWSSNKLSKSRCPCPWMSYRLKTVDPEGARRLAQEKTGIMMIQTIGNVDGLSRVYEEHTRRLRLLTLGCPPAFS